MSFDKSGAHEGCDCWACGSLRLQFVTKKRTEVDKASLVSAPRVMDERLLSYEAQIKSLKSKLGQLLTDMGDLEFSNVAMAEKTSRQQAVLTSVRHVLSRNFFPNAMEEHMVRMINDVLK